MDALLENGREYNNSWWFQLNPSEIYYIVKMGSSPNRVEMYVLLTWKHGIARRGKQSPPLTPWEGQMEKFTKLRIRKKIYEKNATSKMVKTWGRLAPT